MPRRKNQYELRLLEQIEDYEDPYDMLELGCYYYGKRKYAQAQEWYGRAAEEDLEWALNNLGYCYYYGRAGEKDFEKAFNCYMRAASMGNAQSMYKVGDLFWNGYYVFKDYKTAFLWYENSYRTMAEKGEERHEGFGDVCFRLGRCYYHGKGVEKDYYSALKYLSRAEYVLLAKADREKDRFAKIVLPNVTKLLNKVRQGLGLMG